MKRLHIIALFICIAIFTPIIAQAQSDVKPIQIALWHPVQIFDSETSIYGVRISLLYGVNQDVYGLDFGLVNKLNGDMKGSQGGLVNLVEGDVVGMQHDVPQWGYGGRLISVDYDEVSVVSDTDLTIEEGKTYKIKIQQGSRVHTADILNEVGTTNTFVLSSLPQDY